MTPSPSTRPAMLLAASALLLLVAASPAWAQGGPDGDRSQHPRQGPRDLDQLMDHLTFELKLDEEQASEMRTVLEKQREQMQELRSEFPPSDDREERAALRRSWMRISCRSIARCDAAAGTAVRADRTVLRPTDRRGARHPSSPDRPKNTENTDLAAYRPVLAKLKTPTAVG